MTMIFRIVYESELCGFLLIGLINLKFLRMDRAPMSEKRVGVHERITLNLRIP